MKHYSNIHFKRTLGATALCLSTALAATAQTSICTFERPSAQEYKSISVYDPFSSSPFNNKKLKANIAVISNNVATEEDSTQNVLAVQRSRYGSNMFGVKIELAQPIALTPMNRYVHVFIRKPLKSRTMLIGLGKRNDRPGEANDVVQFRIENNASATPDQWYDAVFAIKGNADIRVHSIVVVPDAESRHDMAKDFVAYIDDISVSDNAAPRQHSISRTTIP